MNISISKSNIKMGNISSVSFLPGAGCPPNVPCSSICYAKKATYRMNVKSAWEKNLLIARETPAQFFAEIHEYFRNHACSISFFRWHVAGDILNQDYLNRMIDTAIKFPNIKQLAFTKQYALDFSKSKKCSNLVIVISMWPNFGPEESPFGLPRAWMQDGTETRIPESAIECFGGCDRCGMCWNLPKINHDVVFNKH